VIASTSADSVSLGFSKNTCVVPYGSWNISPAL
jgi:hypothetical protein